MQASSRARQLLAAALQRPGMVVGGLVMTAAAGAIVVNALSFQSVRHPAPFFAKEGGAPQREPAPAVPPVPPTRPPSVTSTASLPPQPSARVPARDPIADMIRSADTTGSASAGRLEPQRPIAAAQRALQKLGYGLLKVDGVFGQETRQAIERFERDRRLTPTGELGARTARELSAASGIRVE
jgi:Putative peptidoglycan binding domain